MIFIHKNWESFCKKLADAKMHSVPAKEINASNLNYIVLKHDVETKVKYAYRIAKIEHKYGHRGSYYVQAYLMSDPKNVKMLLEMQEMGHEISYHYDVMDSCKGDLARATEDFEKNKKVFEKNGFLLETVCQHGNPIVERTGYTSNRDFFRSPKTKEKYPNISDIMVNFKEQRMTDYLYFSDAGRKFKLIYDPINNDIQNSDDKNVPFDSLDDLFNALSSESGSIISIHPHRWTKNRFEYAFKTMMFRIIRATARILSKIPFAKRLISKHYHLAKKI